jgi:hypothetical protein
VYPILSPYAPVIPSAPPSAPSFDDGDVGELYPDMSASFSPDSYLPSDYHMTIGRSYDLSALAKQLQANVKLDDDDDDKDED